MGKTFNVGEEGRNHPNPTINTVNIIEEPKAKILNCFKVKFKVCKVGLNCIIV